MSGYQNFRLAALALACLVLVLPASTLAGKLTDAIRQRDVALVRTLLEAGEDVQEKVRGDFPLAGAHDQPGLGFSHGPLGDHDDLLASDAVEQGERADHRQITTSRGRARHP